MKWKKSLSVFMAVIMFVSMFSAVDISALAQELSSSLSKAEAFSADDEGRFNDALLDMLAQYKVEDGYSKIVIDVNENTLQKDDGEPVELEEYDIDYDKLNSCEDLITEYDILEDVGVCSDAENDAQDVLPQTDFHDGKITVTNPYQSKRLIVQSKNRKLKNTYDAVKSIDNGSGYYVLQFATQEAAKAAKEKFDKNKNIVYTACDEVVKITAGPITDREGAKLIQSDRYRNYLYKNKKQTPVKVAVLDTGVDTNHSYLKKRLLTGYNAYTKKSNVKDANGHGTHVAGIIADNTPSTVKILPVKVMNDDGTGTDLAIKAGIDYAVKKKVNVINLSLGGTCTGAQCPIKKGIDAAIKAGVTVVVAAGNDSLDTKTICPAYINACITVAACDSAGSSVCSFSNYGSAVDVTAPGGNILSCAPGNSYQYMSGTSMAAPFAAAASALLLMENPKLKPDGVEKKLKSICADMLIKGNDKYSGAGIINFGILFGDSHLADSINVNDSTFDLEYFSKASPRMLTPAVYDSAENEKHTPFTDSSYIAKSSDTSVAVFDGRYIRPRGSGSCTITLTMPGNAKAGFKVNVVKKEVWIDYASLGYAGGSGTKSSPYQIKTAAQLARFAKDIRSGKYLKGKYFKLMNDIDLKGKLWITARYYKPMGDYLSVFSQEAEFQSVFDGNNHKIKNMTVFDLKLFSEWDESNPINQYWYKGNTGFIGLCRNAVIKNLGIENGYSTSRQGGLLADDVYQGTKIYNCYTSGYTAGNGLTGGISNYDIVISNCYSSATVLGAGISSSLYSSKQKGGVRVNNTFFCGELLSDDSEYRKYNFTGNLSACKGYDYLKIYNSFSSADSVDNIGFGLNSEYASISGCYYLNTNRYGLKSRVKGYVNLKAKSKSFFKTKSTYTNSKNWNAKYKWDFKNTWAISSSVNNGYPYLKKNKPLAATQKKTGTWLDYAANKFASGNGTKSSPYVIETASQLARLAKIYRFGGGENTYFKITKNIDLSAHTWYPIGGGYDMHCDDLFLDVENGSKKKYFRGNIDGTSKTITGLKIPSTGEYSGFVTKLNDCTIKNLNFKNADVKGADYVGIICGKNFGGVNIVNCTVSGKVSGSEFVGTITGGNSATSVLFGCKSTAAVVSANTAGGITAMNEGVIEKTSFGGTFGDIEGESYAFCFNNRGTIKNCYSISDADSLALSNGFGEIVHSYLAGKSCVLYNNSLYGRNIKNVTSDALKDKSTFKTWDFENVWSMDSGKNKGYPALRKASFSETKYPTEKWKAAKKFAGGKGTKSDPYLIATASQLAILRDYAYKYENKHFRLIRDINLYAKVWDNKKYTAYDYVKFYFDGNNKTVSNMINKYAAGLFNVAFNGTLKNLNMKNVRGASNCSIVPINHGRITNCTATGSFCNSNGDVGGICEANYGTVEKCSVNAALKGMGNVGGIVGYNCGSVKNCYTRGRVNGYTAGVIVANNSQYNGGTVSNCYSVMTNVERSEPSSQECYKNVYIYGVNDSNYSASQLKKKSTYKGFDFSSVWTINSENNNGYPTLRRAVSRKITYVLNGGKATSAMENDYIPGIERTLKNPTRKNYVFAGWYKEKSFKTKVTKIGSKDSGNVKYYAKWKKKK